MYLALDIGGTNIKAAIVRNDGSIVRHLSQPTEAARGRDAMLTDIRTLIETTLRDQPSIQAVGVGVPGIVHPADGCVYYPPNLPGWEIVPLTDIIREYSGLPTAVDNDANAAALAESVLGAGRGYEHFLYITLGTGVGGGIIAGHNLYRGERGGAGEVGHIIIDARAKHEPGQPLFRTGTLEELIGRQGILRTARECAGEAPDSLLHNRDDLDVHIISDAAAQGDAAALECFRRIGYYLGVGLASVVEILDMRHIVVGGGISQAHPLLLDTAQAVLRERVLPPLQTAGIVRAHFGSDAGVIGAAMLARLAVQQQ